MGFRRNCVWYDETKNLDWNLCLFLTGDRYCAHIKECPKNCRNYINKNLKDAELRQKLFRNLGAAAK